MFFLRQGRIEGSFQVGEVVEGGSWTYGNQNLPSFKHPTGLRREYHVMAPPRFSWFVPTRLAALAQPEDVEDLLWLRREGIEVLISLTELPPPRTWVNEAGLMLVHVPVVDMTAPTLEQLHQVVDTIHKANAAGLGVAVHCTAGLGRTGTALAAYLVSQGRSAQEAIDQVRILRPGSIETAEQEQAIRDFAQYWHARPTDAQGEKTR
jgi:atypical dual specificity phosphatase